MREVCLWIDDAKHHNTYAHILYRTNSQILDGKEETPDMAEIATMVPTLNRHLLNNYVFFICI